MIVLFSQQHFLWLLFVLWTIAAKDLEYFPHSSVPAICPLRVPFVGLKKAEVFDNLSILYAQTAIIVR